MMPLSERQRTLARPVSVTGFGYWSDRDITVTLCPGAVDSGICFVRTDIAGARAIPARPEFRLDIPRRTSLADSENPNVRVEMIEHVMAAVAGMHVDNCEIHVDAAELPGLDGSALPFVEAFDRAGIIPQDAPARWLEVCAPLRFAESGTFPRWLEVAPNLQTEPGLKVAFEIDYPNFDAIGNQRVSFDLTPDVFRREIAPCRTFVTQREADALRAAGLAQRATYRDLLVFDETGVIGNSLRFPDECVRHKILDLLGDLALCGRRLAGSVSAHCSGHDLNVRLVEKLLQTGEPGKDIRP